MSAQILQPLGEILIAPLYLVHIANSTLAFGTERRNDHGHAGADIRGHKLGTL